jgi:ABC-type molybdenum transport system ATPase subunit/photorepair protein PhrA
VSTATNAFPPITSSPATFVIAPKRAVVSGIVGSDEPAARRVSAIEQIGDSGRSGSVFALFPVLKGRQQEQSSTLSGGEQQMVAIGRAMMEQPELLLLDDSSFELIT